MNWESDSDGSLELSRLTDQEEKPALPHITGPLNESIQDGACSSSPMPQFLAMGFSERMVAKAIKANGNGNTESILELLLTYSAIDGTPSGNEEKASSDENDWSDDDPSEWDDIDDMDFEIEMSGQASISMRLRTLVEMGFSPDEASSAIGRCGKDAPVSLLADSIYAAQTAEKEDGFGEYDAFNADEEKKCSDKYDPFLHNNKRQKLDGASSSRQNNTQTCERLKRAYRRPTTISRCMWGGEANFNLPRPMVGFGLPMHPGRQLSRDLPEEAQGPPYFYYENVALTPRGVWPTISRFLYGVPPEFVDSKYFSACCRKRGYIHNLPIANRFHLEPMPPQTILEAFTSARAHWPTWDKRIKFNCLQTYKGSARLTQRIREMLEASPDPPPQDVVRSVIKECKKWNLIWVGQNRAVPLEPGEIEFLLGFPRDHTRGFNRIDRYKSLGNAFQVDTVAYHLSVLRDMYPKGMRVLSLFSGIGGAEVALHRLGIKMMAVLSVEVSPINRTILRSWWNQTGQEGELREIDDVHRVDDEVLNDFIADYGGIDLVIGGSPCNNLTGSNRYHRDGLAGEHSRLFYHYYRILDTVRLLMGRH